MRRAAAIVAACLIACSKHGNESERDTKGRATAIIGTSTAVAPVATADAAREASIESPIEGAYVTLTWPGTITQVTGAAPAVGTACTLSAHAGMLPTYAPSHDAMSVTCGDKTLYDDKDAIAGATSQFFLLSESPVMGEASAFRYDVHAFDKGERTGRNQIDVATESNKVTVFSETIPTFRVTIKLAAKREVRHGKPLFTENIPLFSTVPKFTAALTSTKGAPPFASKTCALVISPGDAKHNCRAKLTCGTSTPYGFGEDDFCDCTVDHGRVVSLGDMKPTPVDGDPSLVADLNAKTATLADEPAGRAPWSASFTLTGE
jgi:hypothetical protein